MYLLKHDELKTTKFRGIQNKSLQLCLFAIGTFNVYPPSNSNSTFLTEPKVLYNFNLPTFMLEIMKLSLLWVIWASTFKPGT